MLKQSFVERLRVTRLTQTPADPWTSLIQLRVRGQIGHDGVERISTDRVFELLEISRLMRTPEASKRLKILMLMMNWTPIRARCVTSRGGASRVRGYARMPVSAPFRPLTIEP